LEFRLATPPLETQDKWEGGRGEGGQSQTDKRQRRQAPERQTRATGKPEGVQMLLGLVGARAEAEPAERGAWAGWRRTEGCRERGRRQETQHHRACSTPNQWQSRRA
jgi:hypothetical protein